MSRQSAQQFGPNEWLVEEMYQRYLADPDGVDPAWHDFFADYRPESATGGDGNGRAGAQPTAGRPVGPTTALSSSECTQQPTPAPPFDPAPVAVERPTAQRDPHSRPLRGAAARIAANMQDSLAVPTATGVRAVPAKLLSDNRQVINNHLRRSRGGKVSFTHIIGFALVRALAAVPEMNTAFAEVDGKPVLVTPEHANLGLAIDLRTHQGGRTLVVPSIKAAEALTFDQFWAVYEDLVRRARADKLSLDDHAGTTITLTNPGTIGTGHSVPRLMAGQGAIIGVGAMEYPAEYQGAAEETLARLAVSRILTLTSTYDHRVIQGAVSGDFLRRMHELLLGADGFYDELFQALRVPYDPVRWVADIASSHEGQIDKPARIVELIHAYRVRGHLMADTDPLEFRQRSHPDLDVVNHGLTLWDLDREFSVGGFAGQPVMKLRDILGVLRDSYCRTIGVEYMHIQDPLQREWVQSRVERPGGASDRNEQLHILERLNAAEAFETFLQTKYVGQKRFSLEGGESAIPLLDAVLALAATDQLNEVVIGMPHRGRLNVLVNIVGKSVGALFREFEGNMDPRTAHGSGDVKYHLGAQGLYTSPDGRAIAVSMVSNPSHLEAVDPVTEGVVRAKQDLVNRGKRGFTVLPVLVHGDAAFAGQGVVAETLNLSQLRGYRTGGTLHLVINNQLGFTTAPAAARSSVYATDVARMVQAPIFHVNGDDPEACVRVAKLAFAFRQEFKKDVVIDMVCYRRRGHQELDEPSFTQPLMYDVIDAKRSVRKIYTESLVGRGDITITEAEQALKNYQEQLERVFAETRDASSRPAPEPVMESAVRDVDTAISAEVLKRVVDSQTTLPPGFTVHKKLLPLLARRQSMIDADTVDWSTGELLAIGSLLLGGHPVRLAGQDTRRGTFGQRHAVLVDRVTGGEYTPLAHLSPDQGPFYVYDSLLSEFAAMGFEYGYSVGRPEALVCWEAQFGDFANGAQAIIDEFVAAGEAKWGQASGLALLLPHGYEGQGPDHSSARIERYLALCAEDNMTVAMPSTPASYFHLLRRHLLGPAHRPLIAFTPKSMLRLKTASSPVAAFTGGSFESVLVDTGGPPADAVRRVLLCTGKVYYDLAKKRGEHGVTDTALIRIEQLYPTPAGRVGELLADYPDLQDVVWVQEEPANIGAWAHMALHLPGAMPDGVTLRRCSRRASASPAAGSQTVHDAEQAALLEAAFTD